MLIIETNLKFEKPLIKRITTNKIILHHSASKVASAQLIDSWHRARGWNGMGYHFLVRKNGDIERGRPIDVVGAHCTGQNADSIGVCFEGDFDKEIMEDTQIKAGKELIAYLRKQYGDIRIAQHKDFMATNCAGKNFPFDEITKKAKKKKYTGKLPTLPQKENQYYLEKGDKGENVRLLQIFLNWYGNYNLIVDGDFGDKTLSAVKNFQLSEKLKVDGLFGSKSLKKATKVKR